MLPSSSWQGGFRVVGIHFLRRSFNAHAARIESEDFTDGSCLSLINLESRTRDHRTPILVATLRVFDWDALVAEAPSSVVQLIEDTAFDAPEGLFRQFADIQAIHNAVRCHQQVFGLFVCESIPCETNTSLTPAKSRWSERLIESDNFRGQARRIV